MSCRGSVVYLGDPPAPRRIACGVMDSKEDAMRRYMALKELKTRQAATPKKTTLGAFASADNAFLAATANMDMAKNALDEAVASSVRAGVERVRSPRSSSRSKHS
jgi:hypothetical protein